MHTLYAYLEGFDHSEVESRVEQLVNDFASSSSVQQLDVWLVNQRRVAADGESEWDLGLNLEIPEPAAEPDSWFEDVEEVLQFAARLRREVGTDVVIGLGNDQTGVAEDIFVVDSDVPDPAYLKQFLGVGFSRSPT
jgi:hypothetical protein